ncbi:hypothetical protein PVL29_007092 [Vitis rotundifolia]|uniref:Dirigent protein n=1 Tax=Vitis rotundifolia TaxID=103349 RepID=A0AA39A0S3_VITRO|nr:hypothetical protein PVL29_007092 [Vitis rotundifolia]
MARALLISPPYFVFFIFLIFSYATIPTFGEEYSYVKRVNPKKMKILKEKLSHFRLYWHDIVSGSNPTSIQVVEPVKNSSTYFGSINMIDNPLTIGPKLSSKMVGKAQGFYSSAAQEEFGLLMVMNFVFIDGKYNGSTFTVLGRNKVLSKVREMEVIGGSGLFRFAKGYVQAKTYMFNTTGDATVEYNAYVRHY